MKIAKPLYDRSKDGDSRILSQLEETIGKFELRHLVSSASTDLFTKDCPRYVDEYDKSIYISIQLCEICRYNHGFIENFNSTHPNEIICTKIDGVGRKIKLHNW